jgi:DNA repair exonuclease SbcCD nuclease subunit
MPVDGTAPLRILLLADSHLGFDLPLRPRTERRRRGHDFLANYHRVLEAANPDEVDVVVHAGDVFDRPSVAPSVAYQAYEPLRRAAETGIPVFVVPGNHERSRLPHRRLLAHPNIQVFDRPRTATVTVRGTDIAFCGFPYERNDIRGQFPALLGQTSWRSVPARHRLLCVHHCVEGATVGPSDYMFTTASDVIRHGDIPREFAAVFTGHVHRHQVLSVDREGRRLTTPVLYPGSIERTAFAEADETKGFMVVRLALDDAANNDVAWDFRPLPARPMRRVELFATDDAPALSLAVRDAIMDAPVDAVLSLRVHGDLTDAHWHALSAKALRAIAPPTMNVDVVPVDTKATPPGRSRMRGSSSMSPPSLGAQLALL